MQFNITKEIKIPDDIFDARFHPIKEDFIAAATIGGSLYLIENGDIKTALRKHHKGSPIRRVRFDKNGHMITIAKTVKIHDLEANRTNHTIKRIDGDKTTFNAVLSLDSSIICAGDDAGKVFVWDTRTPTDTPVFSSSNCEQYISDIDGKYEARRMFVCTSGEGTLTAYDLRANKMIEPQSEVFEAGFQCVKMVDLNKKVVIGGEDGALYVFNQNEWAHTSGKFAISDDAQNRGKCSIEAIDVISSGSVFLVACSDGRMRSLTLWPHQVLSEKIVCKRRSLECLQVNPIEGKSEIIVGGENFLNLVTYEDKSESEADEEESGDKMFKSNASSSADSTNNSGDVSEEEERSEGTRGKTSAKPTQQRRPYENDKGSTKKAKKNNDDYLNIFN